MKKCQKQPSIVAKLVFETVKSKYCEVGKSNAKDLE